ncbi:HHK17, histidine kinase-group VII protein [Halenospora varia]|nr:HHK17, histidine kinase-group VII protein [Halenospora varia]
MHEIRSLLDSVEARPPAPRTYRPLRQRYRNWAEGRNKSHPMRWSGDEKMEESNAVSQQAETLIDRASLCLPDFARDSIVHGGDAGFTEVLQQYFPTHESNATDRLVDLKCRLKCASTHDFWAILLEEMCDITGSQCGFVAKRMLVDDQNSAVEMPELGEPGSCLMGVAFYINNGSDVKDLYRDYRYHAYGTPCAHMRHDKVFIVPERMSEFLPNNPNANSLPWKTSEAFIGVPLFSVGKCFAHFGLVWSSEGAAKRKLGWSFIEMFLHSLEDMISQRVEEGRDFAKEAAAPESVPAKVIPLSAITASQSLKPYARSLSHELRTPMQGVVGMLDIMYSTVLDAIADQQSDRVREVFKDLKGHIETVQDSSRRAVEAADNVVYAYDLNMQMPETPLTPDVSDAQITPSTSTPESPILSASRIPSPMSTKRARQDEADFHPGPPLKRMFTVTEAEMLRAYYPDDDISSCGVCGKITATRTEPTIAEAVTSYLRSPDMDSDSLDGTVGKSTPIVAPSMLSPNHRHIVTREFMRTLLKEALHNGRPTSEVHTETSLGETIEVRTIGSRGEVQDRIINLSVESGVPELVIIEELHLQFALQKLIDNAIKFTENGSINLSMKMSKNRQVLEVWVSDTGCGIAEESQPNLFTPHFQEDTSISRAHDGLGLSLFNAKAHVRKNLGGDVTLERSATEGPSKGSEFLVRLPITPSHTTNTDAPLVGTPPNGYRGLPPLSLNSNGPIMLPKGPATFSSTPRRRVVQKPSKERRTFNPNLATKYPLNILIAEDNAINRNVAMGSLAKLGYATSNIKVAFDGVEAVRKYTDSLTKPLEERFDAILMDIWMPNMDGFEASKKIMNLAEESGTPTKIVAVTADITGECLSRAEASGMQGFLAKPYKVLDIEHLIVEHFSEEEMR